MVSIKASSSLTTYLSSSPSVCLDLRPDSFLPESLSENEMTQEIKDIMNIGIYWSALHILG